jgi:hypothetical protein
VKSNRPRIIAVGARKCDRFAGPELVADVLDGATNCDRFAGEVEPAADHRGGCEEVRPVRR